MTGGGCALEEELSAEMLSLYGMLGAGGSDRTGADDGSVSGKGRKTD